MDQRKVLRKYTFCLQGMSTLSRFLKDVARVFGKQDHIKPHLRVVVNFANSTSRRQDWLVTLEAMDVFTAHQLKRAFKDAYGALQTWSDHDIDNL